MSSLAGLKKSYSIFRKSTDFGYLGPPLKSIFSMYKQNFEKSPVSFLGEVVRKFGLNFELSISCGLRGGVAVLQVDTFQNP